VMFEKIKTTIYNKLKIDRKSPVNIGLPKPSIFFSQVNLNFEEVSLFEYSNVNVSPEGIVFKHGQLDQDLLIYPKHKKTYNIKYLLGSYIKRSKKRLPNDNTYLLCFDYWSNSIFHWMCDVLPRIEAVKEKAKDCVLLLPKNYEYPYIHDTLKAFSFKAIYYIDVKTYVHCEKLIVPNHIATSGRIRPDNFNSLRNTLLTYFKPQFSGKHNYPHIYVSRNKAKYRKVLNENELYPILDKYQFKVIYFEDYSVSEQIEICYHAQCFASIHGANLTNSAFMKPNANVLELRKKGDLENNYFYEIADSVGCNYFHLDCDYIDPKPNFNFFSLNVDVIQFEQAINNILK
jgi:hypothetical protein